MFPRIEVEAAGGKKVPVHLYGFSHGTGKKGTALHHTVANAIRDEQKTFGRDDFLIREGQNDALLREGLRSHGEGFKVRVSHDLLRDSLKAARIPNVHKIEPIEHFEIIRSIQVSEDGAIDHVKTLRESTENAKSEEIDAASKLTRATPEQTRESKESLVQEFVSRGIDEAKAQLYVESLTTFRSLLMARAAYHRAYATGLPIRLFVGLNHVEEIERFLKNEKTRNDYVKDLPPELRQMYDINEQHGWGVIDLFEQHSHKFPDHKKEFYAWLALEAAKPYYWKDKPTTIVIDVSKFRRLIARK